MAASLCIRTSTVRVPVASYSCLWYRSSSDFAHPSSNSRSTHSVLRCHFNLHFPDDSWFLASLNMVVSHLYTFSGVVSEPAHFLLLEPLELTILGYVFMCTYVCVCASVWRPEVDFWLFNHSFWDEVSLNLELPCHCDLPNSATPVMELQMRATTPLLGHGLQGLNSGTHGCVESKLFTKLPPGLACRFWAPIRCASSVFYSCLWYMFLFSWQHHYGWEPFNFTKFSLPFLCSWSFLCALPKKSLLYPESGKSFLVIFSEFCSFPLRSMVHFELNFVKGVNSVTSFIVLCMEIQLSQRHW